MKTTHLIGRMHRTRITSLSGGPYQEPDQVLTSAQMNTIAQQTGKSRGNVTWDDVYRVSSAISSLWMQIAPLIFSWRNRNNVPAPPQNLKPPATSGINWGIVLGVFAGAMALGFIMKAKSKTTPKRKGPRYDNRKR